MRLNKFQGGGARELWPAKNNLDWGEREKVNSTLTFPQICKRRHREFLDQ